MEPRRFSWLAVVAAVVAMIVGLTACSSGGGSTSTTSAAPPTTTTPANVSTPPSSSTPVSVPPSSEADLPPATVAPTAGGADAAPGTVVIYDNSATAKANFNAWWNYEIQVKEDLTVKNEAYISGITVCYSLARGANRESILNVLEQELGYTGGGAAGIYKSAISALCPAYDYGYNTGFDTDVKQFIILVKDEVTFTGTPYTDYDFGFFMKENCAALASKGIGPRNLYDHMRASTQLRMVENGAVKVDVLYKYIKDATLSNCDVLFTQLPPVIVNS